MVSENEELVEGDADVSEEQEEELPTLPPEDED
jgi:hypothetical protein